MQRVASVLCLGALISVSFLPAGATEVPATVPTITLRGEGALLGPGAPEDLTVQVDGPGDRAMAWVPRPAGTKEWITLDYGPYAIHPGSDLSRMDVEIVGATGYAVGFEPLVVDENEEPIPSHLIHIHHAHWYWLDPEREDYHRWFYGTGEERTQGSLWPIAKADPRWEDGLRYGVQLQQGDRLGFLSMLHNKTADPMTVYLRVRIQYVYGNHDEIQQAKEWDFHNVSPSLIGSTFNVPRNGGDYVYPLDATKESIGPHSNYHNPMEEGVEIVPGVGQVVTVPFDGTVIVGAGHAHPGSRAVVLSNLGREDDPCPEDGDRFPGTTAVYSRNITRGDVFPSEEFQMGLTQPAWRMYVREGDRLVLNGVYEPKKYAYWDAMSYFGFYTDTADKPTESQACTVELLGDPGATRDEVSWTLPNHEWPQHHPMPTCTRCNKAVDDPEPGPETNVVHIAGFTYLPGNQGYEGSPLGPPVVAQGDGLTFINEDFALGSVRHSVTSCRAPCNGDYLANFPFSDGRFHSGALGYMWEETYINARPEPTWTLDTAELEPGRYTYYCQLHAWMRGSFYVR